MANGSDILHAKNGHDPALESALNDVVLSYYMYSKFKIVCVSFFNKSLSPVNSAAEYQKFRAGF